MNGTVMDNYFLPSMKNRNLALLHANMMGAADSLNHSASKAALRHLKKPDSRIGFENEIRSLIDFQINAFTKAKNENECRQFVTNLYEEKRYIDKQSTKLLLGSNKLIVSVKPEQTLNYWGYFINGVGVIVGTGQVIGGIGIAFSSAITGNVIGAVAGTIIVMHGLNNLTESRKCV